MTSLSERVMGQAQVLAVLRQDNCKVQVCHSLSFIRARGAGNLQEGTGNATPAEYESAAPVDSTCGLFTA